MKIEIYENGMQGIKGMVNINEDINKEIMNKYVEALKREFKDIEIVKHEVIQRHNVVNSLMNIKREKQYMTRGKVANGLMNIDNKTGEVLDYDRLPIVMVNRNVVKVGSYPTINEIKDIIEEDNDNLVVGI